MGEPKPLASLTSGLLARKGAARPAMRRQPLGSGPADPGAMGYDDLGWNDMGYDVDPQESNEQAEVFDLKPLLTESMPAHNVDAENAVDAFDVPPVTAPSWAAPAEPIVAAKPAVVQQREDLAARVEHSHAPAKTAAKSPPRASRAVNPARARDKAAFTLRLDAERHLRLRLASAIYNRSAQQILIDVLDEYLAALPEIDAMASRLPAVGPGRTATQSSAHSAGNSEDVQ